MKREKNEKRTDLNSERVLFYITS